MNAPVNPFPPADWVWRQRTVETFMGRRGDICLSVGDIIWAGGAPIFAPVFLGAPSSQVSPPSGDRSTWLATTEFVQDAIEEAVEKIELKPGPPGPQGPIGPEGPKGAGLAVMGTVDNQSELPTTGNQPGDVWLDKGTGGGWVWDGFDWEEINLGVGPEGPQGPDGVVKVALTEPAAPETGELWWNTTAGGVFIWSGHEWVEVSGGQGPQGAVGPEGPQGPVGNVEVSATKPTTPVQGDFWYDLDAGGLFIWLADGAGQWVEI